MRVVYSGPVCSLFLFSLLLLAARHTFERSATSINTRGAKHTSQIGETIKSVQSSNDTEGQCGACALSAK